MKTKTNTFRQILSFYKPYKGLFAADLLCSLTAAAIGLVLPLGAGAITENVLTGDLTAAPGKILRIGGLLLGLVAVQALCSYFMDYQGHSIGAQKWNGTCAPSCFITVSGCPSPILTAIPLGT